MNIQQELDTCGLNCPLPILKTKKALSTMQSGELLRVRSTDAGATRDFQAFAKQTGHVLIEHSVNGQEFVFVLQRK
jgi:TusA-related sulfurtransferase